MRKTSSPPVPPAEMPYSALLGQVIKHQRIAAGIDQAHMAAQLGLSQSAYSRLETGDTVMNVWQLRLCCDGLGVPAALLMAEVQRHEDQLRTRGISIVAEKRTNPAAAVIGIAILAAILGG